MVMPDWKVLAGIVQPEGLHLFVSPRVKRVAGKPMIRQQPKITLRVRQEFVKFWREGR